MTTPMVLSSIHLHIANRTNAQPQVERLLARRTGGQVDVEVNDAVVVYLLPVDLERAARRVLNGQAGGHGVGTAAGVLVQHGGGGAAVGLLLVVDARGAAGGARGAGEGGDGDALAGGGQGGGAGGEEDGEGGELHGGGWGGG